MLPLLALLACGEPVAPESEVQVESLVLSTSEEEARTRRELPIHVQAMDVDGASVGGVSVWVTFVEGKGWLEPLTDDGVQRRSAGRGLVVTTGRRGAAELRLIPSQPGPLSLQAFVGDQARITARLDVHVTLRIGLDYEIPEPWQELFGLKPGFGGGDWVPEGTPVEWSCDCDSDWAVVGTLESTGETVFDSGTLGPDDVFRWVAEGEGEYEYRDPLGGARARLAVTPALYSARSTSVGATPTARRAGMAHEASATTAIVPRTRAKIHGVADGSP